MEDGGDDWGGYYDPWENQDWGSYAETPAFFPSAGDDSYGQIGSTAGQGGPTFDPFYSNMDPRNEQSTIGIPNYVPPQSDYSSPGYSVSPAEYARGVAEGSGRNDPAGYNSNYAAPGAMEAQRAIENAQQSSRGGGSGGGASGSGKMTSSGTPQGAQQSQVPVRRPGASNSFGGYTRPLGYNGLPGSSVLNSPGGGGGAKMPTNLNPQTVDGRKNLLLYAAIGIGLYYLLKG